MIQEHWDILIWEQDTRKYTTRCGPFKTYKEARQHQKEWQENENEISILKKSWHHERR